MSAIGSCLFAIASDADSPAFHRGTKISLLRRPPENPVGGCSVIGTWPDLCLEQKHEFAKGIEEVQKAVDLSNNKMLIGFVAHAMALSGNKAGAGKILGDLEKQSQQSYVSPWLPAIVYPDLGEKEKAFFWLEKASQGREHDLVFSNAWPMFDSLHSDPRYQDLLRRAGLPQ